MNVKSDSLSLLDCAFRPLGFRYNQLSIILYLRKVVKVAL